MEIKKVLANVSQDLTETEMSTARKNIGVTADLLQSTDASMTFTDTDNDKIGIALNGYDTVAGNGIVIDTDDLNHTFSIRTSETYDTVVNLDTTLTSGKYKLADNAGGTGPVGVDLKHGTLTVANSVSYTDTSHTGNQMVSDAYQMLITADGVPYYRTYNGKSREFTEWVDGFGPKGDNIYLDEDKTTVMYATSTSDQNPESIAETSWSTSIPTVQQGQYLWVRTILAFSDESTANPIYNVVYKAKDIGLDKTKTKVEYGTSPNGTDSTSVTSWSPSIPSVDQGQYLWVRTTLAFSDESTADPIYNVVYQPKDIKLDSDNTKVEYGIAKSKYATPSSWSPNVPAIDQGDYLWVRTTMHFSDGSVAPEFCHVIYEPKDGSNGVSCTHSWNGTTLSITSASGTSSADLKGEKGDPGTWGGSVDTELSNTSTNPVQNKVVYAALSQKVNSDYLGSLASKSAVTKTDCVIAIQKSLVNADSAVQPSDLDGYVNGIDIDKKTTFDDESDIVVAKAGKNILTRTVLKLWDYIKGKVSQSDGTGAIVTRDSDGNLKYTNDITTSSDNANGNMLAIKSTGNTRRAGIKLGSMGVNFSAYLSPQGEFTDDHEFILPDASGTLALTNDVATLTGDNRFTGTNTFTSGTYMNGRLYITRTSGTNIGLEIENSLRKIKMTIIDGQLKLEDDAGKINSPSSAQSILYSTGTVDNTKYNFNGDISGNADTVDGLHFVVGEYDSTASNTVFFIG